MPILMLGYYGLLGVGLALALYLFISLKREIWKLEGRRSRLQTGQEQALQKLQEEVNELKIRLRDAEERAGMLVAPAPPPSGLNLAKRGQALRMCRQGETPAHIASALQLPENEIELLLKVHRMSAEARVPDSQPGAETGAPAAPEI